tara:strand:+ start:379 stop:729 length:351 start_codon:yes stop_codon:yes gene_type:complete
MIEDFVIREEPGAVTLNYGLGGRQLNFKKIASLPQDEFAKLHLELMEEYRDENGWWSEDKIPHCGACNEVIQEPKDLRRYHGRSLHPTCFNEVYGEERDSTSEFWKKYWDKVAKLA